MPAALPILKIIGDILSAILPPLLTWLFSGSVTQSVKEVKGLPQLDTLKPIDPVQPQLSLPVLGEDPGVGQE